MKFIILISSSHIFVCKLLAGELVIAPQTTEAKVGDTTYFNCSTNLTSEEIFWYHGDKYVYIGEPIIDPYKERFKIERTTSNLIHNLVIQSVKPSDAGEYTCVDNDGLGTKLSAYLLVLGQFQSDEFS